MTRGATEAERLTRALVNLAARGLRTHCSDPGTSLLWISEISGERGAAARFCGDCPMITEFGKQPPARGQQFGPGRARPDRYKQVVGLTDEVRSVQIITVPAEVLQWTRLEPMLRSSSSPGPVSSITQ